MIIPEGDDDELGVPSPLLDVVGYDGDILKIQGCVDLVHHVQGSRLMQEINKSYSAVTD